MQQNHPAEKVKINEVSRMALPGSDAALLDVALVRAAQLAEGKQACFRTEQRLLCANEACEWRRSCRRLVAVWRR